jgi:hypothetical protein
MCTSEGLSTQQVLVQVRALMVSVLALLVLVHV